MSNVSSARILGSIAAVSALFALTACGGSSSTPALTTHPSSGPRHVQVLMFGTSSPLPSSFISNVLPNITGVTVPLSWNKIESSNSSGTGSGGYDFSSFDAGLTAYLNAGAKVNLLVWPATEGGNNNPNQSGSTPAYVFSPIYAAQLGAPNPQDMAVCGSYTGDSGNPFYSQANSGSGGGLWNASVSSDLSGLPVSYELPFMTAYQNFITAVIQHYNAPGALAIGYIRFGMSQGGENSPECNQYWPNYSENTYIGYVTAMTQFITEQNPSMTILEDLHAVGDPVVYSYADQEAALAVANKEGFGTNGLQQNDVNSSAAGSPCDSDWCNLFAQYQATEYGGTPITLSLQTLQWTDPTGATQTGSLTVLEPFAKSRGANNLELYLADVGLAFDPSNYCGYLPPSAGCPSFNPDTYSGQYAAAIQDFLAP